MKRTIDKYLNVELFCHQPATMQQERDRAIQTKIKREKERITERMKEKEREREIEFFKEKSPGTII